MSFPLSFHPALLGPTGAHWLDDPSDLSCQDRTQQYPVDGWPLSCNPLRATRDRQFRMPVRQLSPDGISGAGPTVVAEVWWPRMPRRTA
jgi:hypothetical protein